MKNVLITGCMGYIGGSLTIHFKNNGYEVIGIDVKTAEDQLEYFDKFYNYNINDYNNIQSILELHKPEIIIHCAGSIDVLESFHEPLKYYENNVSNTITFLKSVIEFAPNTKFMFCSSASVYDDPKHSKILSIHDKLNPKSVYGKTKLIIEDVLKHLKETHNLKYSIMRFFNVAGSYHEVRGQNFNAKHIIPSIIRSSITKEKFVLNGVNFQNTADRTCVRDYVHIEDLCEIVYQSAENQGVSEIFNVCTGVGLSNLEILDCIEKVCGEIDFNIGESRKGDSSILIGEPDRSFSLIYQGIYDIIFSAYYWHRKYHKID
jgi:UDP-glucose 4-epimerase